MDTLVSVRHMLAHRKKELHIKSAGREIPHGFEHATLSILMGLLQLHICKESATVSLRISYYWWLLMGAKP